MNNPLKYKDPTGMTWDDVFIWGYASQSAFDQLQQSVNGELVLTNTEGRITYSRVDANINLSENAQQLVNAIDDHSIAVNVTAENTTVLEKDGSSHLYAGGAFLGNYLTIGDKGYEVYAEQQINPSFLEKMSTSQNKPGQDVLHEVTEAYQGGLIAKREERSSPSSYETGSFVLEAHQRAVKQTITPIQTAYDEDNNIVRRVGNVYLDPGSIKRIEWTIITNRGHKIIGTWKR